MAMDSGYRQLNSPSISRFRNRQDHHILRCAKRPRDNKLNTNKVANSSHNPRGIGLRNDLFANWSPKRHIMRRLMSGRPLPTRGKTATRTM